MTRVQLLHAILKRENAQNSFFLGNSVICATTCFVASTDILNSAAEVCACNPPVWLWVYLQSCAVIVVEIPETWVRLPDVQRGSR